MLLLGRSSSVLPYTFFKDPYAMRLTEIFELISMVQFIHSSSKPSTPRPPSPHNANVPARNTVSPGPQGQPGRATSPMRNQKKEEMGCVPLFQMLKLHVVWELIDSGNSSLAGRYFM
jgi:hypothetical protein